jgi:hypothetical protein
VPKSVARRYLASGSCGKLVNEVSMSPGGFALRHCSSAAASAAGGLSFAIVALAFAVGSGVKPFTAPGSDVAFLAPGGGPARETSRRGVSLTVFGALCFVGITFLPAPFCKFAGCA